MELGPGRSNFGHYSPKCVEKPYEKVSSAGKAPHHEANHGSIYERFAARR